MSINNELDVEVFLSAPTQCPSHDDVLEEVDRAAALLGPELDARNAALRIRVLHQEVAAAVGVQGSCSHRLTVNGVAVQDISPPAEVLVATIHRHLDRDG